MSSFFQSTAMNNFYRVSWNHQQNHVLEGLKHLSKENDLFLSDVTLACDGEYIKSHKLVLSLYSSFFKDLLTKNKTDHSNTIIVLGNVTKASLRLIMQFIYEGEVYVPCLEFEDFLNAGKLLKIVGLCDQSLILYSRDVHAQDVQPVINREGAGEKVDAENDSGMDANSVTTEPNPVSTEFHANHQTIDESVAQGTFASLEGSVSNPTPVPALPSNKHASSSRLHPSQGNKSFVWKYFHRFQNIAHCQVCKKELRILNSSTTSGLRRHLQNHHQSHYNVMLSSEIARKNGGIKK